MSAIVVHRSSIVFMALRLSPSLRTGIQALNPRLIIDG